MSNERAIAIAIKRVNVVQSTLDKTTDKLNSMLAQTRVLRILKRVDIRFAKLS